MKKLNQSIMNVAVMLFIVTAFVSFFTATAAADYKITVTITGNGKVEWSGTKINGSLSCSSITTPCTQDVSIGVNDTETFKIVPDTDWEIDTESATSSVSTKPPVKGTSDSYITYAFNLGNNNTGTVTVVFKQSGATTTTVAGATTTTTVADATTTTSTTTGATTTTTIINCTGFVPDEGVNGFFNNRGYIVKKNSDELLIVSSSMEEKDFTSFNPPKFAANTRTIDGVEWGDFTFNGKTISMPMTSDSKPISGEIAVDTGQKFTYSKNYLNFLFFSGLYTGDGLDQDNRTRWFYAKKAALKVGQLTRGRALYNLMVNGDASGATSMQPWKDVYDPTASTKLDSAFINNVNNVPVKTYSPLAEMMSDCVAEFAKDQMKTDAASADCADNFLILISAGIPSKDADNQGKGPDITFNHDKDTGDGIGSAYLPLSSGNVPVLLNIEGGSYADDIAYYAYNNDIITTRAGTQNIITYTVGFKGKEAPNQFLMSVSNHGNGLSQPHNVDHPDYGKYHFVAESPDQLAEALWRAISAILSRTNTFTAPVVPVTRTTSGNTIYMAFFKPMEGNLWEGNVTKFGLSNDLVILDKNGDPATYDNGAMKETAESYWQTKDWALPDKSNFMHNAIDYSDATKRRNIYTYLGASTDLTHSSNTFSFANVESKIGGNLTVGSTTYTPQQIYDYVRGADVLDADNDGDRTENRKIITGDVLHSEPSVVRYVITSGGTTTNKTIVLFGSNDGMLHAVDDETGKEVWAFIPPHHLPRLRLMLSDQGHSYYVDSSPKVYILDANHNGYVDAGESVYVVSGDRKGSTSYWCLDITTWNEPKFKWRVSRIDDSSFTVPSSGASESDHTVPSAPAGTTVTIPAPTTVISELGESWSEATFGKVATDSASPPATAHACFLGGGYPFIDSAGAVKSQGNAVIILNVETGGLLKKITSASPEMGSIVSSCYPMDVNGDEIIDKIYVGDLSGQLWRIGYFRDATNSDYLPFPKTDPNINNWAAVKLLDANKKDSTGASVTRKFFYAPSVTLERGYDLVLIASGDRENPCDATTGPDAIFAVKDNHKSGSDAPYPLDAQSTVTASIDGGSDASVYALRNVTPITTNYCDTLKSGDNQGSCYFTTGDAYKDNNNCMGCAIDNYLFGYYLNLPIGEKILAEGTIYYGVFYITTFMPTSDPCVPGGYAYLYGLHYKSGAAVEELNFAADDENRDGVKSANESIYDAHRVSLGGGIPSKPVTVLTDEGSKLLVSVGTTEDDGTSLSTDAGIAGIDPLAPARNFWELWWRER